MKKHKYPLAQWPIISLYTKAGIYVKPWLLQVQLFMILPPQLFQRLECQSSVMSLCFCFFLLSNIPDHSEHSNGHVKRTDDASSIHSLPVPGFLLILSIYLLRCRNPVIHLWGLVNEEKSKSHKIAFRSTVMLFSVNLPWCTVKLLICH